MLKIWALRGKWAAKKAVGNWREHVWQFWGVAVGEIGVEKNVWTMWCWCVKKGAIWAAPYQNWQVSPNFNPDVFAAAGVDKSNCSGAAVRHPRSASKQAVPPLEQRLANCAAGAVLRLRVQCWCFSVLGLCYRAARAAATQSDGEPLPDSYSAIKALTCLSMPDAGLDTPFGAS